MPRGHPSDLTDDGWQPPVQTDGVAGFSDDSSTMILVVSPGATICRRANSADESPMRQKRTDRDGGSTIGQ